MRVLLIYFSGTGHTARCAKCLKQSFEKLGHEVEAYGYKHDEPFSLDVESFDMLGFGYPIHAFNLPQAFHRFLKNLPKVEDKPFFIFKVSGEPFHLNDASSHHTVKHLIKKGYHLVGEKHFLMPYNIVFRYPDALAKQMVLYLGPLCELFARDLCEGTAERIPYRFSKKVLSFFLRIEWIAPKVNAPLVHMKKKRCNHCLRCVRECPMGAIIVKKNGKLRIRSSKCAMCMRCTMNCSCNAISFGIMNPWKVNGPYPFEALIKNPEVDPHFVHEGMKGYFRHFLPYFRKQDAMLKEKGIPHPLDQEM